MNVVMTTGRISEHVGDLMAIDIIARAGFDGIDMSLHTTTGEKRPWSRNECTQEIHAIRERCKTNQLMVNQVHLPFTFPWEKEEALRDDILPALHLALEAASELEAPYAVLHPVHHLPYAANHETLLDQTRTVCNDLIPFAEKLGVKVAIENMFEYNPEGIATQDVFADSSEFEGFLNEYNHPFLVACVDVGHAQIAKTPPGQMIRDLTGKYVKVLHIHDNDGSHDLHMPPYLGMIDWQNVTNALHDVHYDGSLCMEVLRGFYGGFTTPDLLVNAAQFVCRIGKELGKQIL